LFNYLTDMLYRFLSRNSARFPRLKDSMFARYPEARK